MLSRLRGIVVLGVMLISIITLNIIVYGFEYSSYGEDCIVVKLYLDDILGNSSLVYIPEYNVVVSSYYLDDLGVVYIKVSNAVLNSVLEEYNITVIDEGYINDTPVQVYAGVKTYDIESILNNTWLRQNIMLE